MFIGKYLSFFRRKDAGKVIPPPESPIPEPEPEPDAEELEAIEAERVRAQQELIRREKESMVRAADSRLYQIYQTYHGLPPVTDD